jgi:hypothetical protein
LKLVAHDNYGNEIRSFPTPDEFKLQLFGDIFSSANEFVFQNEQPQGNTLSFSIASPDVIRYRNALDMINTPYQIKLTYKQQSVSHNVNILGDSSLTYTNEKPTSESVSLTPTSSEIIAGEWTEFTVKLKTPNGKLWHQSDSNGWYESVEEALQIKSSAEF